MRKSSAQARDLFYNNIHVYYMSITLEFWSPWSAGSTGCRTICQEIKWIFGFELILLPIREVKLITKVMNEENVMFECQSGIDAEGTYTKRSNHRY